LTTGSPGDGIDNDCDGLIDEEHCSDSAVPGTIGKFSNNHAFSTIRKIFFDNENIYCKHGKAMKK
jgi:hypothetical protein